MPEQRFGAWSGRVRAAVGRHRGAAALAAAAAALLVFAAAVALLAPALLQLGAYGVATERVHWIEASWEKWPRRAVAGERARSIDALPRGGGDVQAMHLFAGNGAAPPGAVFLPAVAGQVQLYVNGAPIRTSAESSVRLQAVPASRALLIPIPREYYHPGTNRLDLVISDAHVRPLSASLYLGSQDALRPGFEAAARWTRSMRALLPTLAGIASLAALAAAAAGGAGARWFLPIAAAGAAIGARAFIARAGHADALGELWPVFDRLLLVFALLVAASLRPARPWPGARMHDRALAIATPLSLGSIASCALAFSRSPALASLGSASAVVIAAVPLGLTIIAWSSAARHDESPSAAAAAAIAGIAMVGAIAGVVGNFELYLGARLYVLETAYGLSAALIFAAAAVAASVSLGHWAVRAGTERLNLARRVKLQREEIDSKTRALRQEMRRAAILEERQRLARDMHDGIGGQLISLIARVRSRRVGINQVERELVDGLAELRLVVDSLDAAGESLSEALAVFRSRARAQVEAAGMAFSWSQPDDVNVVAEDPRWTLNIYRFLQEAVSNAIRHSHGAQLDIRVKWTRLNELSFEIADDGTGIAEAVTGRSKGHGLDNMAHRARQLSGQFGIDRNEQGGLTVRLRFPLPQTADQSRGEMSPS